MQGTHVICVQNTGELSPTCRAPGLVMRRPTLTLSDTYAFDTGQQLNNLAECKKATWLTFNLLGTMAMSLEHARYELLRLKR